MRLSDDEVLKVFVWAELDLPARSDTLDTLVSEAVDAWRKGLKGVGTAVLWDGDIEGIVKDIRWKSIPIDEWSRRVES